MEDIYLYTIENILRQAEVADGVRGCYPIRLYSADGRPSREATETVETFYYYPSGGTIRDRELNILFYEPKLDRYHTTNRDR
jgi:hypothetical protein